MDDLNDLYYFAMVVEHGGFAAAERALGIPRETPAAQVPRVINTLEAHRVDVAYRALSSRCHIVDAHASR